MGKCTDEGRFSYLPFALFICMQKVLVDQNRQKLKEPISGHSDVIMRSLLQLGRYASQVVDQLSECSVCETKSKLYFPSQGYREQTSWVVLLPYGSDWTELPSVRNSFPNVSLGSDPWQAINSIDCQSLTFPRYGFYFYKILRILNIDFEECRSNTMLRCEGSDHVDKKADSVRATCE